MKRASRPGRSAAVPLALSFRAAAALLRIDRGNTLHMLIKRGLLRPVPWGKGQRIPLEQVQQLARTGFEADPGPARRVVSRRGPGPPAPGVGDRIRALVIKD